MKFVSLTQAKSHLRIDTADEDTHLDLLIDAATEAVHGYIKPGPDLFFDSAGDVIVDSSGDPIGIPADVKAATLLMLGYLYKDRDNDAGKEYERGYLPRPVTALLYRYREPVMR